MPDVRAGLVGGRRVKMRHRDLAVAEVADRRLARMAAVPVLAIAQLDVAPLGQWRCGAFHQQSPPGRRVGRRCPGSSVPYLAPPYSRPAPVIPAEAAIQSHASAPVRALLPLSTMWRGGRVMGQRRTTPGIIRAALAYQRVRSAHLRRPYAKYPCETPIPGSCGCSTAIIVALDRRSSCHYGAYTGTLHQRCAALAPSEEYYFYFSGALMCAAEVLTLHAQT